MTIVQIISVINQMEADGVVARYAIGGAVGATFYLEPVATLDVDIFVTFRHQPDQVVVNPRPIFDYLTACGGVVEGEYIVMAGWPIQFLPATSVLVEEALAEAVTVDVKGHAGAGLHGGASGGDRLADRAGQRPRQIAPIHRGCGDQCGAVSGLGAAVRAA